MLQNFTALSPAKLFWEGRHVILAVFFSYSLVILNVLVIVLLANMNSRSRSLYVVVRPSVVCLSITFVHPTQAIKIFGNVSTAFSTVAIC